MLGKFGWWRHAVVGATVLGCAGLALFGVIGTGEHTGDERFESKFVVVEPAGPDQPDGLRITEVVDIDFGGADRHGYERYVENDFGAPVDITATSPDAPDEVDAVDQGFETRIRIGDPDSTVSGRHRYVLRYTLPDARVSQGLLALDVIGNDESFVTERFEVVVTGLELSGRMCNVGPLGTEGGCNLAPHDDGTYRTVIEPLDPGEGITIGGSITGTTDPVDVTAPPEPPRPDDVRVPLAIGMGALGTTAAAAVFAVSRRRGRNQVFGGGGAADAAFGSLPRPGLPLPASSTTLVADDELAALATIEFVPPAGLAPWQGAAVLFERLDDDVVAAWFSGHAATGVITLEQRAGKLVVGPGPKLAEADEMTRSIVATMLNGRSELTLGSYDKHFATAWGRVRSAEQKMIKQSGWWTRLPSFGSGGGGAGLVVFVIVGFVFFGAGSAATALLGAIQSLPLALLFGTVVPAVAAWSMYRVLLPARSATGSAVALRTESFRRFLEASEGRHVQWAWEHGLLREYSAWAVSLGAATAWARALAASNVPAPEMSMNGPLLVHSMRGSMISSRTAPSSRSGGSGFSGGFSGGHVGGGGGGGRSGSW
ncbi:MAG: hypothetical protein AB7L17_02720 [Ilumatobacteraceae bacterium]